MVDTAEPDGSLVSAEELGRGWDGAADISAGWTGDAGGLGSEGIEAAELCRDVAEELVKGTDGGTPDGAKDDAAGLNSSSWSLSPTSAFTS